MKHRPPTYRPVAMAEAIPSGDPLFGLGSTYATPKAIFILRTAGLTPAWLLGIHQSGHWGDVSQALRRRNDVAVRAGDQITSVHVVQGTRLAVVTEAADATGTRRSTVILVDGQGKETP